MTIKHKLVVNAIVFILAAFYLAYREMLMIHPDAISFLNLTM